MTTRREHWNSVFRNTRTDQLGWYEEVPRPSLRLVSEADLEADARVLDAGAGATTLLDHLLDCGYDDLVAVDVSRVALQRLADRLGPDRASRVEWVVGDLTDPSTVESIAPVDLWHDRAVLHFLTDERDRTRYLRSLRTVLRPGGRVIMAAFSPEGADRCSGLEVRRYDHRMISDLLGDSFRLVRHFDHLYRQPGGDPRPFVYTLLRHRDGG